MKTRIAAVAFLLTTVVASTASAELSLGMGTRWTATRWYQPVFRSEVAHSDSNLRDFVPNAESALDAYFLLAFSKKFGVYLQLDYMNLSWSCTGADEDEDACDPGEEHDVSDMSFSSFGAELGIKYFFAEPRRAAISPMLILGIFKYFASYDDNGEDNSDDLIAMAELSSPFGGRLAIGVEYNFSNNFSIGAEIFGLNIAAASTSTFETGADASTGVSPNADTSYFALTMYTALTLNFRFYGLFRVYTREEEEQATQEEHEDRRENQQFQQQQQQWEQPQQQQQQPQQWQQQQQWQQPQQQQQQWQQPQQQQYQQPAQDPNQQWQQQQQPQPTPGQVQ